jgi:hypothetical protein
MVFLLQFTPILCYLRSIIDGITDPFRRYDIFSTSNYSQFWSKY